MRLRPKGSSTAVSACGSRGAGSTAELVTRVMASCRGAAGRALLVRQDGTRCQRPGRRAAAAARTRASCRRGMAQPGPASRPRPEHSAAHLTCRRVRIAYPGTRRGSPVRGPPSTGGQMDDFFAGRGNPWDHDPGPPANRKWAGIFAHTPNYRGFGNAVLGKELFRWHFGPMFYRGRLTDGDVKVLVIGQEGAQDESPRPPLVPGRHRRPHAARAQPPRHHPLVPVPQHVRVPDHRPVHANAGGSWPRTRDSPIVQHRHELYDEVLARNDLRLVIAVGTAAKESVVTWITSRGGTCPDGPADVSHFTPRAACSGRARRRSACCTRAARRRAARRRPSSPTSRRPRPRSTEWADDDPTWLPRRSRRHPAAGQRLQVQERPDPVPRPALRHVLAARLGGGTSSNRNDDQRAIQLFSDGRRTTTARATACQYASDGAGTDEGYADEPRRPALRAAEAGPARLRPWAVSVAWPGCWPAGQPGLAWPDFGALGVGQPPVARPRARSTGAGYAGVSLLVLADQEIQRRPVHRRGP